MLEYEADAALACRRVRHVVPVERDAAVIEVGESR